MKDIRTLSNIIWFWVLLAVLVGTVGEYQTAWAASGSTRKAVVYYSDGTVRIGTLRLTGGRMLKLNIPEGGTIKTTDMVTGADVPYGKVRKFTIEPLRSITTVSSRLTSAIS